MNESQRLLDNTSAEYGTCYSGSENDGYSTADEDPAVEAEGDANSPQVQHVVVALADAPSVEISFNLQCQELRVFRITLRILSLWCPTSACCMEKYVYPLVVNFLLLLMLAAVVNMLAGGAWNSVDTYMYLAIDLSMYLSHVFGLLYFRSRDLEENMLNFSLDEGLANEFKKALKRLKYGIFLSFPFTVVLVLLFFNTEVWLRGRFQCNSSFKFLKGFLNHFVCLLNYPTNIYGVGNSLTLSWMMCLFQQVCFARLRGLHRKYIMWTESAEDAIYDYMTNYSRRVKNSCVHLEKWFVTHNIILIVAIPFLFYDIVKAFEGITKTNAVHTGLFLGYLVYTLVIWVAPLYFAELLQIHDENFCSKVNEFCPRTFQELEPELQARLANGCNQVPYIFHSRIEVGKFLTYLGTRKSGFLIGSYSFQFKLSIVSIVLALMSFATRVIG